MDISENEGGAIDWDELKPPGDEIEARAFNTEDNASPFGTDASYWKSQGPWVTGGLIALGAPRDLRDRIPELGSLPGPAFFESFRSFLRALRSEAVHGEVVFSGVVWEPVIAIAVAVQDGATATGRLEMADETAAGWEVSIGGFGLDRQRTYEIGASLEITAEPKAARAVELLIPMYKTVRKVVPKGGYEPLNMPFYEHVGKPGDARLGSRSVDLDLSGILSRAVRSGESVPLGGDAPYQDKRSRKTTSSLTVSFESSIDNLTQGLAATFKSQMKVEFDLDVHKGSHLLTWFDRPLGALISSKKIGRQ